MKGPGFILFAIIIWSIFRAVLKSTQKVKKAQQQNVDRSSGGQDFASNLQTRIPKQLAPKARPPIELLDSDREAFDRTEVYSEIDPTESEGSHFVLNRGMTGTDRSSVSDDIARDKADRAALPTMLSFTREDVRRYVIMKEVLGAPRAMRPYALRRSYYTPADTSRD